MYMCVGGKITSVVQEVPRTLQMKAAKHSFLYLDFPSGNTCMQQNSGSPKPGSMDACNQTGPAFGQATGAHAPWS
jgi:hypothetical protein